MKESPPAGPYPLAPALRPLPKALEVFLVCAEIPGRTVNASNHPAFRRRSQVVCSLCFAERYSSSASRTSCDSRAPVATERSSRPGRSRRKREGKSVAMPCCSPLAHCQTLFHKCPAVTIPRQSANPRNSSPSSSLGLTRRMLKSPCIPDTHVQKNPDRQSR